MWSFLKIIAFLILLEALSQSCNGCVFTFKMHHRFSDRVSNWQQSSPAQENRFPTGNWPEKGSSEFYAELAHRDQMMLRGRRLSDADAPLAFSDGNSTFGISSLGFLHYTTVQLGMPGLKFMVALDTGSDLFWVPCDCGRCETTRGLSSYASVDVLHLRTEDSFLESVEAYVTLGCGQVQSGSFLDIAAPGSLLGLGMESISVPSILSREGFTADSFSICFGRDGIGRISFGDKGSSDQEETPFNLNPSHPTYNITVTQVRVGTALIDVDFTALFDSGTSFTYLVGATYARVVDNVQDRQRPADSRIPFEYCYYMRHDANPNLIPSLSLRMKGGSHFIVYDPIIVISTRDELVYYLAIVKSAELNIIGQFYDWLSCVVFDREKLALGWKKFDCYDVEEHNTSLTEPRASTVPPALVSGLENSSPESKEEARNNPHNSVALQYSIRTSFTS